jgi:hypothetical protein
MRAAEGANGRKRLLAPMNRNRTGSQSDARLIYPYRAAHELIGIYDVTGRVLIATVEEIHSEGLYKRRANTRIIADALAG